MKANIDFNITDEEIRKMIREEINKRLDKFFQGKDNTARIKESIDRVVKKEIENVNIPRKSIEEALHNISTERVTEVVGEEITRYVANAIAERVREDYY